jgi:hypothetical protein
VVGLLRRDIRSNYYGAAAGIVQVSIESEQLQPVADQVLKLALPDGQLRRRLGELPFGDLLASAAKLGKKDFNEVVGIQLDRFEDESDEATEDRTELSQALSAHVRGFDKRIERRISEALENDRIRTDFGSYVDLVEERPDLIPPQALIDGNTALRAMEGWNADQPAFRIIAAALKSKRANDPTEVSGLSETVTKDLFELMTHDPESRAYSELAKKASRVLLASKVGDADVQPSVDRFNTEWPQIPPGLRPAAMNFVAALLSVGPDEFREQHSGPFVDRFFVENPSDAIAWSKAQRGGGRVFSDAIDQQLGRLVSDEDETLTEQATKTISKFARAARKRIVSSSITAAMAGGRYQRAARLLDDEADLLGDDRQGKLEGLIQRAEEESTPELLDAVSLVDPSGLTEDLRRRQSSVIAEGAAAGTNGWQPAYDRIVTAGSSTADDVLSRLFAYVTEQAAEIEQHLDQVKLLAENQEKLKPSELRQLGKVLIEGTQRVIVSPPDVHNVPHILEALGKLTKAETDDRKGWVTDLIVLERQQGDLNHKEQLLTAADALAGPRGKAREEFRDRLEELREGSEAERDMVERVEGGAPEEG